MLIPDEISQLIDEAAAREGSQAKLARLIGQAPQALSEMRQGKRPCNWRVRGKIRTVLGEAPERAFMTAMAEDLEQSENPDEKKAAEGFRAILAAFPTDQKRRKR